MSSILHVHLYIFHCFLRPQCEFGLCLFLHAVRWWISMQWKTVTRRTHLRISPTQTQLRISTNTPANWPVSNLGLYQMLSRTQRLLLACDFDVSVMTCLVFTGIATVALISGTLQLIFWQTTAYRQGHRIRLKLFTAILKQDIGWFDTNDSGQLNTRLNE